MNSRMGLFSFRLIFIALFLISLSIIPFSAFLIHIFSLFQLLWSPISTFIFEFFPFSLLHSLFIYFKLILAISFLITRASMLLPIFISFLVATLLFLSSLPQQSLLFISLSIIKTPVISSFIILLFSQLSQKQLFWAHPEEVLPFSLILVFSFQHFSP